MLQALASGVPHEWQAEWIAVRLHRQQTFVLDARELFVRNDPLLGAAAAAVAFAGVDAAEPTPLANRELGSPEQLGYLGDGVPCLAEKACTHADMLHLARIHPPDE